MAPQDAAGTIRAQSGQVHTGFRPPGIRHLLDGLPQTPAYVVDAAYNVLAWNRLATHFIGDLSGYEDRNMIRWTFRREPTDVIWTDEHFVRFTRRAHRPASLTPRPRAPGFHVRHVPNTPPDRQKVDRKDAPRPVRRKYLRPGRKAAGQI